MSIHNMKYWIKTRDCNTEAALNQWMHFYTKKIGFLFSLQSMDAPSTNPSSSSSVTIHLTPSHITIDLYHLSILPVKGRQANKPCLRHRKNEKGRAGRKDTCMSLKLRLVINCLSASSTDHDFSYRPGSPRTCMNKHYQYF